MFQFLVLYCAKNSYARFLVACKLQTVEYHPFTNPFSLYAVCCYSHPFTDPSLFHLHHLWRWCAPSRRVILLILEDRSLGDIQRCLRSVLVASVDVLLDLFFDCGTQQPWRPRWLLVQYRAHQHHRQRTGGLQLQLDHFRPAALWNHLQTLLLPCLSRFGTQAKVAPPTNAAKLADCPNTFYLPCKKTKKLNQKKCQFETHLYCCD